MYIYIYTLPIVCLLGPLRLIPSWALTFSCMSKAYISSHVGAHGHGNGHGNGHAPCPIARAPDSKGNVIGSSDTNRVY